MDIPASRCLALALGLFICLLGASLPRAADTIEYGIPFAELSAENDRFQPFLGDFFGDHIAATENWLFIGAPRENYDVNGDGAIGIEESAIGVVRIYRLTEAGIELHQTLVGPVNPTPDGVGTRFGSGLEAQGQQLLIAAANDQHFPGLRDRRHGRQVAANAPVFGQFFRDIDDVVDIAPPPHTFAPSPFHFAGQVHYYRYNGATDSWEFVQRLRSDDPASEDGFGSRTDASHMALQGDFLLIGEGSATRRPGSLHVFRFDNADPAAPWQRVQVVQPPDGGFSVFGDAVVDLGGGLFIVDDTRFYNDEVRLPRAVGESWVDGNGHHQLAYQQVFHVYRRLGDMLDPEPVQTLADPAGIVRLDELGFCTAGSAGIDSAGGVVAIAYPCAPGPAGEINAGALDVYAVTHAAVAPLAFETRLHHPDAAPETYFGRSLGGGRQSVAVNGEVILAGAPLPLFSPPLDVAAYLDTGVDWELAGTLPSPPSDAFWPMPGNTLEFLTLGGFSILAIGQMNALNFIDESRGEVRLYLLP
jgi:hypothetical protein